MIKSKLNFSIPANNSKIIELYNKLKKDELDPSPHFQRKLVWRKQHKYNFIQTILQNYPFPEVYLAPGNLDVDTLVLKDQIVDGQQRLTTIINYIDNKDVFSLDKIPIKKFSELDKQSKEDFLNYEVSVRYLKNASSEQIKDKFQRINSTEYSLNKTERLNAQWGDSEFICFAKQMIEKDLDIHSSLISYKIEKANRKKFLDFFRKDNGIFKENDLNRMLALQWTLTLLATICEEEYFKRNDKVQDYIIEYFEEFTDAGIIETKLIEIIDFINSLELPSTSYWYNKSNIFTIIVELYKIEITSVSKDLFKEKLLLLEKHNNEYVTAINKKLPIVLPLSETRYFDVAREGVNDKSARETRGELIKSLLGESFINDSE